MKLGIFRRNLVALRRVLLECLPLEMYRIRSIGRRSPLLGLDVWRHLRLRNICKKRIKKGEMA